MDPKKILPVIVLRVPLCPSCGAKLSAIAGDGMPEAGDFNVCAHCYAVSRFTGEAFRCRLAAASEIEEAAAKDDIASEDADFLRLAFAAHARRHGGVGA